ncbi:hypothetical protein VNI00_006544 [Paramarasmius palmivorus]|uniref:Golgin-84 n=1 Tax=Paramarasmius palmivorus TaxID=297713 RepID=A0AAW0D4Y5_9AGAR
MPSVRVKRRDYATLADRPQTSVSGSGEQAGSLANIFRRPTSAHGQVETRDSPPPSAGPQSPQVTNHPFRSRAGAGSKVYESLRIRPSQLLLGKKPVSTPVTLEGQSVNIQVPADGQPGRIRSALSLDDGVSEEGDHHHDDIVEHLEVIDPQVSHLTNAANSILLPPLAFYSRKPVVMPSAPPPAAAGEERGTMLEDSLDRHDLKEERGLEASVGGLRSAYRQQEQSADKSKEESRSLELSSQKLRAELAKSLAYSAKLEGDLKSLTKSLATTHDAHENAQSELAKTQTSLEQLRQKHETDITLAREQFAAESKGGLSEEVSRLQTLLGERDSIIQHMQEERDGLTDSVTTLRTALKQMQERSEDENWNLEESSQHSRSQTMFSRASGFTILDGMFNNVGRDLIVRSFEYWTEGPTSCVLPPSMQLPQPGVAVIGYDAGYGINVEPNQPIDGLKGGDSPTLGPSLKENTERARKNRRSIIIAITFSFFLGVYLGNATH